MLDYQRYPHIVDQICNVDRATLLTFRGLSRYFLNRIDRKLFDHVMISRPESEFRLHVERSESLGHQVPPNDLGFQLCSPVAPYLRLPSLPWNTKWSPHASQSAIARKSRQRAYELIRVVDYHGAFTKGMDKMPNLVLVRRYWAVMYPDAISAPTTLDYLNYTHPSYVDHGVFGTTTMIAKGVRRYVLRVKFDVATPPGEISFRGTPETVEVVFEPQHADPEMDVGEADFQREFIKQIQNALANGVSVTIAGLEQLPQALFDLHDTSVLDKFKAMVQEAEDRHNAEMAAEQEFYDQHPDEEDDRDPVVPRGKLTFLTKEEWLAAQEKDPLGGLLTEPPSEYVQPGNDERWYDGDEAYSGLESSMAAASLEDIG